MCRASMLLVGLIISCRVLLSNSLTGESMAKSALDLVLHVISKLSAIKESRNLDYFFSFTIFIRIYFMQMRSIDNVLNSTNVFITLSFWEIMYLGTIIMVIFFMLSKAQKKIWAKSMYGK